MCYEADARECHRWFVAERAVTMSAGAIKVVHLTVNGEPRAPQTGDMNV